MARNCRATKKEKKPTSENDLPGIITRPWPDFPKQLLNLIGRQPHMFRSMYFGGVAKSWRAAGGSGSCSPQHHGKLSHYWLQLSVHGNNDHHQQSLSKPTTDCLYKLNISFRPGHMFWYCRQPPGFGPLRFVGFSHGIKIVAATGEGHESCSLIDPSYGYPSWWCVPAFDSKIPIRFAVLSTSPGFEDYKIKDCFVIVLTYTSHPAFLISKVGSGREWMRQDCTLIDPNDASGKKQFMQFTNAVGVGRRFYALSLQGTLAVIEENNSQFGITKLSTSRAVPSVPLRHFREYLIESDGEVLLVFLISTKSINVVDNVEVFKLHLARLSWEKMKGLGSNRTIFVGASCCMAVTASQIGCKSNRVYYSLNSVDGWQEYDLASGNITSCDQSSQMYWEPNISE